MKAHGLIERDGKLYAYRLTGKGAKICTATAKLDEIAGGYPVSLSLGWRAAINIVDHTRSGSDVELPLVNHQLHVADGSLQKLRWKPGLAIANCETRADLSCGVYLRHARRQKQFT